MKNDKETQEKPLEQLVLTRLMRLNATIYGIIAGILVALGIFIATNWLIIKGGPIGPEGDQIIGPNLWLLNQFFIGYQVTFVGSLIGAVYGFVSGFIIGYSVAILYNWLVNLKEKGKANV